MVVFDKESATRLSQVAPAAEVAESDIVANTTKANPPLKNKLRGGHRLISNSLFIWAFRFDRRISTLIHPKALRVDQIALARIIFPLGYRSRSRRRLHPAHPNYFFHQSLDSQQHFLMPQLFRGRLLRHEAKYASWLQHALLHAG